MQTENEGLPINDRHGSVLLDSHDDLGAQTVFDKAVCTVQNALSAANRDIAGFRMGWIVSRVVVEQINK